MQADKLFKLSPKRNLKVAYELKSKSLRSQKPRRLLLIWPLNPAQTRELQTNIPLSTAIIY